MVFGHVFDNLTFNLMTSLSKKIQSVANYFLNYGFGHMQS